MVTITMPAFLWDAMCGMLLWALILCVYSFIMFVDQLDPKAHPLLIGGVWKYFAIWALVFSFAGQIFRLGS